jgi:hypothetical protein
MRVVVGDDARAVAFGFPVRAADVVDSLALAA